jgi:hypothetical protein
MWMASTQKFRENVEDVLRQVPGEMVDQVGIVLVDMKGVVCLEVFDHQYARQWPPRLDRRIRPARTRIPGAGHQYTQWRTSSGPQDPMSEVFKGKATCGLMTALNQDPKTFNNCWQCRSTLQHLGFTTQLKEKCLGLDY